MIYLDYSATTPVNDEVLDSFVGASKRYIGNANSLHKLGVESKEMIDMATSQIASLLKVKDSEIIYTSGSSESNNLAIFGIVNKYSNRGKHIITSPLEHSSISEPLEYLKKKGYEVDIVNLDSNGRVDLEHLKELIRDDTILVSICGVNSELGIEQPINDIGEILNNYPKCYFHVDMTQMIGKIKVDFKNVDLASFSAHKFYGLKGIGVLVKKEKIEIDPIIFGGKSTTIYRSGTPALPLIVSLAKALRLSLDDFDNKYNKVMEFNKVLRDKLSTYEYVTINSPIDAIPHILNISILGVKPETFLHALEEKEVYISTQSACSSSKSISSAVLKVTGDEDKASSSIRVSISYLTTKEEIEEFLTIFDDCYNRLITLMHC